MNINTPLEHLSALLLRKNRRPDKVYLLNRQYIHCMSSLRWRVRNTLAETDYTFHEVHRAAKVTVSALSSKINSSWSPFEIYLPQGARAINLSNSPLQINSFWSPFEKYHYCDPYYGLFYDFNLQFISFLLEIRALVSFWIWGSVHQFLFTGNVFVVL